MSEQNKSEDISMSGVTLHFRNAEEATIAQLIFRELNHAEAKHPLWPDDLIHRVSIISEESGEITKAVNQLVYESGDISEVKKEVIQTAATCVRMLKYLTHV